MDGLVRPDGKKFIPIDEESDKEYFSLESKKVYWICRKAFS
jgi:hypothetical protein